MDLASRSLALKFDLVLILRYSLVISMVVAPDI